MIIECQKHLFDIPYDVAYLNNAYMSPLMHRVVAAMKSGIETKVRPWTYKSDDFFVHADRTRRLAAKLWGSAASNIAFVPSASYGLQIAANALPLFKGQHILVLEDQFPSNIYPWQEKAAEVGAEVKILPIPLDDNWTQRLLDQISPDTAIVAIPQTHWSSGATIDLGVIRKALDDVGGALVLDLTQSLGAQPFEADIIRPDFAVAATYKWLMGPYSMGFLYVDSKWHKAKPLENNWMNRLGSEDFSGLTRYRDEFRAGAIRFDMGEKSNAAQLMATAVALEQILDWGVENISQTLSQKTDYISNSLSTHGVKVVEKEKRGPHYLGLRFEGGAPAHLMNKLSDQQVYISMRGPLMRVTPHLYTNSHDIERFLTLVKSALP